MSVTVTNLKSASTRFKLPSTGAFIPLVGHGTTTISDDDRVALLADPNQFGRFVPGSGDLLLMAAVRHYRLAHGRELAVSETVGLVALSVHDGGRCVAGPLAVRVEDLDTVRSVLGDLVEAAPEEAPGS